MEETIIEEKVKQFRKVINYKWKVQTAKDGKASFVAYIDSRQVADILDQVCGPLGWQDECYELKGSIYSRIGIKDSNGNWSWKTDVGSDTDVKGKDKVEKEKAETSDAFKRAAVKWGIGRFLYDLPSFKCFCEQDEKYKSYTFYSDKDKKNKIGDSYPKNANELQRYIHQHSELPKMLFEEIKTCQTTQDLDMLFSRIVFLKENFILKEFIQKRKDVIVKRESGK